MYFKIGPTTKSELFSWILSKHPTSTFEKFLGNGDGRKACGKFDSNGHYYEGSVQNDSLVFLETARKLNMSNYIHVQMGAVCPHNLKGFATIFSSVLKGNVPNGGDITKEQFFESTMFDGIIGPYPCDPARVTSAFQSVDIEASPIQTDGTDRTFMFVFKTLNPVSSTELFQKLYIISYFLTINHTLTKISDEQISKFIELSKAWLDTCVLRNTIVNTLARRNKDFIKKFETGLLDGLDEEAKSVKISEIEEMLTKKGLHQKRHEYILDKIDDSCKTLIDLGCAEGRFLSLVGKHKPTVKAIGLEANPYKVRIASMKVKSKNVKIINSNILLPMIRESDLLPDFLTLIEVIEHLEKEDRHNILRLIKKVIVPAQFVLTTPNFSYNANYGMDEGVYRHRDHKIEYTYEQLKEEVLDYLETDYDLEIGRLFPEDEIEPTFIVYGVHKDASNRRSDIKRFRAIQNMYAPIYLETSGYEVNSHEISNGFASLQFLLNGNALFYLAPTMSPVDYNPEYPDYLEHPSTCFDYYSKRGIRTIVGEEKYMGSRGYMIAFKYPEHAHYFGLSNQLTVNSRNGFPFFQDNALLDSIYRDFVKRVEGDFIILDCEIMPWIYKAQGLINKDFVVPGESLFLSRKYGDYGNLNNCETYLQTLANFAADGPLEIRPFHALAEGNIKRKGNRFVFTDVKLGHMFNHMYHMTVSHRLRGDILKPIKCHYVEVSFQGSRKHSIKAWEEFCENGGEGFVYKPMDFTNYAQNGYLIQPALKVRGRKYLQIIYGIDYREPDCFEKVCHRSTFIKRKLAIQEFELSTKLLKAFLNGNSSMQQKLAAAFIGMENVSFSGIDATL